MEDDTNGLLADDDTVDAAAALNAMQDQNSG
jgi:hypothetical protein